MVQLDVSLKPTPHTEEIGARCKLSRAFERAGNFKDATSILGHYWQGAGRAPNVKSLPKVLAAEVLLRVGVLTGWLDRSPNGLSGLRTAESIINEALSLYESLHLTPKIAEAKVELAECCRRSNRPADARTLLLSALDLIQEDCELKGRAIIRLAVAESVAGNHAAALSLLDSSHSLFESNADPSLTGKFYNSLVAILLALVESETAPDARSAYLDRIFIVSAVARMFFESSGHTQGVAEMENNLGYAYYLKGRYFEAIEHLEAAREIFTSLGLRPQLANGDETRARVHLALNNAVEAEMYAALAIAVMDEGGEQWGLSAALITHGRALASLDRRDEASAAFLRARAIAESAGDYKGMQAVDEAKAECMPRLSNVVHIETRRKTIVWGISDDSMEGAGIHQGHFYEFRAAKKWRDGDIVAVETNDGKFIAYISNAHPKGIWLKWANPLITPKWFASVVVFGVLIFEKTA